MKAIFFVLACLAAAALATQVNWAINDEVNADPSYTFKASIPKNFGPNASLESIKRMLGWKPSGKRLPEARAVSTVSVPASWSAVQAYPDCVSCAAIQNQGECGSCWAFGAVESFTDRLWIHSNGSVNYVQMSEQQMTSCNNECSGCSGCDAGPAWQYIQRTGLTTGGQTPLEPSSTVGDGPDACYPYTQPTCTEAQQPCLPNTFKPTEKCTLSSLNSTCADNMYKANKIYAIPSNFGDHATELFTNGPIEACFTVYENFLGYTTGVYNKAGGKALGGHCVRCSGYGTQNGVNYLQCLNSWTPAWGDEGFFLIGFGVAGMGGDSYAGMPAL